MPRRRQPETDSNGILLVLHLTEHTSGFLAPGRHTPDVTYAYHGSLEKSLRIPWPIPTGMKAKAMRMGNKWVWEIKARRHGTIPKAIDTGNRTGWLMETLREFNLARTETFDAGHKATYKRSLRHFFDGQPNRKLDDEWMYAFALEQVQALPKQHAHNSKAIWMNCLKAFINYCIDRGFLTRNPFRLIQHPKMRARTEHVIHTDEEIETVAKKIFEQFPFSADLRAQGVLYWRFIYATGMRRSEPLKLTWERHVFRDRIVLTETKTGNARFIPLTPAFQDVVDIVASMREFKDANNGRLFPWAPDAPEVVKLAALIRTIMDAEKIPRTNRPIHDARATAAVRWRRAGIPETMLPTLLGHGWETYLAYYRTAPEPSEIRSEFRLSSGNDEQLSATVVNENTDTSGVSG